MSQDVCVFFSNNQVEAKREILKLKLHVYQHFSPHTLTTPRRLNPKPDVADQWGWKTRRIKVEGGMVRINYNQKETKRRPGCFNYFSLIIWFCGGKPGTAKKRKMKSNLNYMERKCRGFLHMVHLFSTVTLNSWQGWWLAPKPWCKLSMETVLRCSHAGSKLFRMVMTLRKVLKHTDCRLTKTSELVVVFFLKCLLQHTRLVSIQTVMLFFCCFV